MQCCHGQSAHILSETHIHGPQRTPGRAGNSCPAFLTDTLATILIHTHTAAPKNHNIRVTMRSLTIATPKSPFMTFAHFRSLLFIPKNKYFLPRHKKYIYFFVEHPIKSRHQHQKWFRRNSKKKRDKSCNHKFFSSFQLPSITAIHFQTQTRPQIPDPHPNRRPPTAWANQIRFHPTSSIWNHPKCLRQPAQTNWLQFLYITRQC